MGLCTRCSIKYRFGFATETKVSTKEKDHCIACFYRFSYFLSLPFRRNNKNNHVERIRIINWKKNNQKTIIRVPFHVLSNFLYVPERLVVILDIDTMDPIYIEFYETVSSSTQTFLHRTVEVDPTDSVKKS